MSKNKCTYTAAVEELQNVDGIRLVRETATLPDGATKTRVRVHQSDTVHIIPFINDDEIIILREYRAFYGQKIWMLPSGKVDKETDIHIAAQRELQEETGYKANDLQLLYTALNTESVQYSNHIFLAKDLEHNPLEQDDDEFIETHVLPFDKALENILTSPVVATPSAYGLLRYAKEYR